MPYTVYSMSAVAGIVLAGGRSSRMGTPKAHLEWHGTTLLRHITGVVGRAVDGPVIVVSAPDQSLPDLDPAVLVRSDPQEGRGPMQGLAVGLAAAAEHAETAFVCSTDLPFLHTAFVNAVLRGFRADPDAGWDTPPELVLPIVHGFRQPLAAGYRTSLAPRIADLLAAGHDRPGQLVADCRARMLTEQELLADRTLAATDPELRAVRNVNTTDDYADARSLPAPEVVVERFGVLATNGQGHRGPARLKAANLGSAAGQLGLALNGHIVAAVNGDQIRGDGGWPLQHGDTVAFLSADAGG